MDFPQRVVAERVSLADTDPTGEAEAVHPLPPASLRIAEKQADLDQQTGRIDRLGKRLANIHVVTFAELKAMRDEPPQRAAIGVAKVGVTVNAGAPKVGKTTFSTQMAAAVAAPSVETFLGEPVVHGPVLLILEEGDLQGIRWRLVRQAEAIGADDLEVEIAHRQRYRLDDRGHVRRIRDHVRGLRPAMVILDPLNRLHSQDENKPTAMTPVMDALADISAETSCAVVAIHHLGKPSMDRGGSVWDRFRGASSIRSATDGNLALDTVRDGIRLRGEFRDAEPLDVWLRFDRDTLTFDLAERPEAPSKVDPIALRTFVEERGQVVAKQVAEEFGIALNTAKSALRDLGCDQYAGARGVLTFTLETRQ